MLLIVRLSVKMLSVSVADVAVTLVGLLIRGIYEIVYKHSRNAKLGTFSSTFSRLMLKSPIK